MSGLLTIMLQGLIGLRRWCTNGTLEGPEGTVKELRVEGAVYSFLVLSSW